MMATVDEAIRWARGHLDALDSEVLLADLLGRQRGDLLAMGEHVLEEDLSRLYEERIRRRADGEPVAYLTGKKEFFSLEFVVDPRVMIPRPETEGLAEEAIRHLRTEGREKGIALDVGTGSGVIAVVLARALPGCRVLATDLSEEAIQVARMNARRHEVEDRIDFLQGDLADPLTGTEWVGRLDIIVSNPPYVDPAGEGVDAAVATYEPPLAVFAPGDPLEVYRRLAAAGRRMLRTGGMLACEVGLGQAAEVVAIFEKSGGLGRIRVHRDLAGIERVVTGRRGASEEGDHG